MQIHEIALKAFSSLEIRNFASIFIICNLIPQPFKIIDQSQNSQELQINPETPQNRILTPCLLKQCKLAPQLSEDCTLTP